MILDVKLDLRRGALCYFYGAKRSSKGKYTDARNFKENYGKPHFLQAVPVPMREKKMRKVVGIMCVNREPKGLGLSRSRGDWYLQGTACAIFA